jgi:predicted NAD/FAD-dependent oxidoreductase
MELKTESIERFVAVPGMSAICGEMAAGLPDCRFGWRVDEVRRENHQWTLQARDGESVTADVLLLAIPPDQVKELVGDETTGPTLDEIRMRPCWAVMAVLDQPLSCNYDAAFVNQGPLAWLARQASKGGRPGSEAWVLHANPDWSEENLEASPDEVVKHLLDAAGSLPGVSPFRADYASAHRWRYALASQPLHAGSLWFGDRQLALAGDWCHGSRVEGAFLSGMAAAGRVMAAC